MKVLKFLFFLSPLGLFFASCSTEVDLEAEWEDIPVVYAFLSAADSVHYVRVQKVFLEPDGNAIEIAGITDSIYYGDDVSVEIEHLGTGEVFPLQRINGTEAGLPKDEGVFANEPNVLYRLDAEAIDLQGGDRVRLRINRSEVEEPATATTTIVGQIDTTSFPSPSIRISRWDYNQVQAITWRPSPEAEIFDVRVIIRYRESTPEDISDFQERQLVWPIADDLLRDPSASRQSVEVRGESFYGFLASQIEPSQGEIRLLDGLDIIVTAGGQEVRDLVDISNANIGITSAQNIPVYTNVEGGLGIFSSRSQLIRRDIRITQEAQDSLVDGIFTKELNFR